MWYDGWHSFLRVRVLVPVRGSRCLFWRETHTKGLRARFPTRLEEDKGRKVPEKTGGRTEENREKNSLQNRAVRRREQATSRMYEPRGWVDQHEKISQHSGWLWGKFVRIHAPVSSQNARKVSQTSPFLRLELTQVCICLFSFLPPSRLRMLCFVCP